LEGANAIYQGSAQISIFLGPGIAGAIIALFSKNGGGPANPSLEGISIAFAVDAFTFLVSTITLWLLREEPVAIQPQHRNGTVLTAIREGIRYMWNDPILRVVYVLVGVINFLFMGPLMVGIPVLADRRLPEGAAAFGLIISAYGGGNLLGILMAGSLPKPSGRFMERLLVISLAIFGVGIAYFAFLRSTWVAFFVLLALGIGNGYLVIIFITYLQRRTPKNMLGRVMSLILFANAGLTPISQALAGAVIKLSMESMFLAAGILVVLTDLWLALQPQLRAMSRELVAEISAGLKRGEETPTNP
jgi:MFS family permease